MGSGWSSPKAPDVILRERHRGESSAMRLEDVARTSAAVAETPARRAKIDRLASCLRGLTAEEVAVAVAYLSGELPGGAIGVGWALLRDLPNVAREPATLELLEVDAILGRIRGAGGPGSQTLRRTALADLFARATEAERGFLVGLLLGDLRQGALEGVMVEAVAKAFDVPATEVRRALMLAGSLGAVAAAVAAEGRAGLAGFRLALLRPIQPMLSQTATDLEDALQRVRPAAVEWKLDGARIQVHRVGDEVRVFTRNLADISDRVPEILEAVGRLPLHTVILDGEAIALRPDGRPQPFQATMSRFGSRIDVGQLRRSIPLSAFFFDCLHVDGDDVLDRPASDRFAVLAVRVPDALRVPRIETAAEADAQRFLDGALAAGHEGVMVKALDAPHEAGRRGASWLKVKRAHTLDLVVLAAEWGHGRRRGRLSNLHLGARDPATGGLVMLGKTFKGMTDEMLAWQTARLLELASTRELHTVHVRPELVVEIAFDGVQDSARYPGGLALRFARVKRYRPDKRAEDADTIDTVRAIRSSGQP
jgi:ATP-dependent DNA ligase I